MALFSFKIGKSTEDKIHEIEIELDIDIASADSASANSLIDVLKKYRKKMLYLCVSALILISGFAWLVSRVESGSKLRLGFFQKNIARHMCRLSGV